MPQLTRIARLAGIPLLASLALFLSLSSCGAKKEPLEGGAEKTASAPSTPAPTASPATPAPAAARSEGDPVSIDPDKEEAIRTGTPAERLASKYELLVERILLERAENAFNIDRAIDQGLVPLAREHNRLHEEGVIDPELTLAFARLAQFILAHHIYSNGDPFGEKAKAQIANLRAMIPAHEKRP